MHRCFDLLPFSLCWTMLSLVRIWLFLAPPLLCRSAFTTQNSSWCWNYNCVREDTPGNICYYPAGSQTNSTFCSGGHSLDFAFETVLGTHLNQTLSIAYYDPNTYVKLGGVNYSLSGLNTNTSNVTLCLSGQVGHSNEYQTMCESAKYDNDITLPGSYCLVDVAQHVVSDGCYVAMPNTTNSGAGQSHAEFIK